jgi:hypothetical protein
VTYSNQTGLVVGGNESWLSRLCCWTCAEGWVREGKNGRKDRKKKFGKRGGGRIWRVKSRGKRKE